MCEKKFKPVLYLKFAYKFIGIKGCCLLKITVNKKHENQYSTKFTQLKTFLSCNITTLVI